MQYLLQNWVLIAVIAYFFHAAAAILDKFLIDKRIPKPSAYAFFVGIFGILALFLAPFGFFIPDARSLFLSIISGFLSVCAFFTFFTLLKRSEASRVLPILGGISPVFVLFLSQGLLGETLQSHELFSFLLLIGGAVLISLTVKKNNEGIKLIRPESSRIFFLAVVSAFLFALTYVLFKAAASTTPFLNAFIWSRLGGFAASFIFLLPQDSRRSISYTLSLAGKQRQTPEGTKEDSHHFGRYLTTTGMLFLFNKIIGATGFFLINYAYAAAHSKASIVNAMQGLEYALVFLSAFFLSRWHPSILHEDFGMFAFIQKSAGIGCIAGGLFILAYR